MPIRYFRLGGAKRLHEIVMVGAHDAAITMGHGNVQTQNLDIGEQANKGVRFFDLRIAAEKVTTPTGGKGIELKAYHGGLTTKTKMRPIDVGGVTQQREVATSKMSYEGWGLSLTKILGDAHLFVTNAPTEFLILKFDKCKNWELIAEACVAKLGTKLYAGGGHLNTKQLADLAGKVIVLFPGEGLQEIAPAAMAARQAVFNTAALANTPSIDSILKWQNLQKETTPAYGAGVHGLQYYGGFGDSMMQTSTKKKIDKNLEKQEANLGSARHQNRNVIRMMYWTTTGVAQNIRDRNREMWQPPNLTKFLQAWDAGMSANILAHVPNLPGALHPNAATQIREYFPNIVMIDFADKDKCRMIYDLNNLTTAQVAQGATLIGQRAV